jgi:hypothetical protein
MLLLPALFVPARGAAFIARRKEGVKEVCPYDEHSQKQHGTMLPHVKKGNELGFGCDNQAILP